MAKFGNFDVFEKEYLKEKVAKSFADVEFNTLARRLQLQGEAEQIVDTNIHDPSDTHGVAKRYDAGKLRFDLLPPDGMEALARVYGMGAEKYGADNWAQGMDYRKCFASMMRHSWAWMRGENYDEESGEHHMVHAAWNALTIAIYTSRGVGNDDRPNIQSNDDNHSS